MSKYDGEDENYRKFRGKYALVIYIFVQVPYTYCIVRRTHIIYIYFTIIIICLYIIRVCNAHNTSVKEKERKKERKDDVFMANAKFRGTYATNYSYVDVGRYLLQYTYGKFKGRNVSEIYS